MKKWDINLGSTESDELLKSMKDDFVHGSSWYYEMSIQYIEKYKGKIDDALENLADIRPGMCSISNIIEAISIAKDKNDFNLIVNNLKNFGKNARKKISENPIEANTVITISNSSAVKDILMVSKVKRIYLMESVPGNESQNAKRELSKFADVVLIPDSSIFQFIEFSDCAIIGFDGIYSAGYLTNKVGTFPLIYTSNYLGIPTIAVGESYKATDGYPPPPLKINYNGINVGIFDKVPLSFISELITDTGTIKNPGPQDVIKMKNYFIQTVLNNRNVQKL
jgi:translation initiation factor 2B subunit (eIF-2B alpha/beta/delta family)